MTTEDAETPVFLYETLAPLGWALHDETSQSPSSSGYTMARSEPESTADLSSVLTTTKLYTSIVSSPTIMEDGKEMGESQESVRRTSAYRTDGFIHGVASSHQEPDMELETFFSEDIVETVEMEAPVGPVTSSSNDEDVGFLSLDVDDLGEPSVAAQAALAEEKRVMMSDIRNSAAQEAPPWARTGMANNVWFKSPFLQLHQEIVDFCNFVAPTEEEKLLREAAVQRVREVVQSIWPSCQVKVFGSFATGLFLPTSDCDVVILESGCQVPQDGLRAIASALTRKSLVKNLQVIGKARVPIVKFVETQSNIAFDISFDVANGPDAAEFIRDAMAAIPPLKPLCLVLKIFLQQRELNEVYTGGIGSYALLVMLLTHLQMHPSRRNMDIRGEPCPLESNLGILLVDFFEFYGRALNVRDVGISCRSGGRFFSKTEHGFFDSARYYLLSVEDPQSPDNDIGKNSYAVTKVRSAFLFAHRLLTKMVVEDVPAHVGLLGRIVRMDKDLIRRKSMLPELPERGKSTMKGKDPSVGNLFSPAIPREPDTAALRTSNRSRWQDYKDDDFPRGGEPEAQHRLSRKRKHAEESANNGQVVGSSHSSEHHGKLKRFELLVERGGSSSGEVRTSRHAKDLVGSTVAGSPFRQHSRHHEHGRETPYYSETRASYGRISRHQNAPRREVNAHDDTLVLGRRMPDEKKSKWRKQSGLQKEESHEEGEIIMKDDFATFGVDSVQQKVDVLGDGAGTGYKKHKRWFAEGRSPKHSGVRHEHRAWIPEEKDEDRGRFKRKVVITKPAHKKIKYL